MKKSILSLIIVFIAFLSLSCVNPSTDTVSAIDKQIVNDNSDTTNSVSKISVVANSLAIMADGTQQDTVIATLIDSLGSALDSVYVKFFALSIGNDVTNYINLSKDSVLTDSLGMALIFISGDSAGVIAIVSEYQNIRDTTKNISLSSVNGGTVLDLTVEKDTLYFESSTEIIVSLFSDSLSAFPNQAVKGGVVYVSLDDTLMGLISSVSLSTDAYGVAKFTFNSDTIPGKINLTFSYGASFVKKEIVILSGSPEAANILVSEIDPPVLSVKMGGAIENSKITFTVITPAGKPIDLEHQVMVKIRIIQAPNNGSDSPWDIVYLSDSLLYTDANGQVSTTLNAGTASGNVIIEAFTVGTTKDIRTIADKIIIRGGLPDEHHFTIIPQMNNYPAWLWSGIKMPITIYVADRYGNPVPNGTAVNLFSTAGLIQGVAFTEGGICYDTLVSAGLEHDSMHTDFGPWKNDLDPSRHFNPDSSLMVPYTDANGGLVDMIYYTSSHASIIKNGHGMAWVMASTFNDSSTNGDTSSSLIWAKTPICFSGEPYTFFVEPDTINITSKNIGIFTIYLADPNGNPCFNPKFSIEVSDEEAIEASTVKEVYNTTGFDGSGSVFTFNLENKVEPTGSPAVIRTTFDGPWTFSLGDSLIITLNDSSWLIPIDAGTFTGDTLRKRIMSVVNSELIKLTSSETELSITSVTVGSEVLLSITQSNGLKDRILEMGIEPIASGGYNQKPVTLTISATVNKPGDGLSAFATKLVTLRGVCK